MKIIDLTHTIKEDMPVYPGTDAPKFTPANDYEKDGFKETLLQMYTHTGTHIDPPAHLFADRTTLDQFPISQFVGKALVIDFRELNEGEDITMGNCKGIGFDVIGLDPIADANLTRHKKLFKACNTVNIENLTNLELCGHELFWFSCYPLKLEQCDGSPLRAVAWLA